MRIIFAVQRAILRRKEISRCWMGDKAGPSGEEGSRSFFLVEGQRLQGSEALCLLYWVRLGSEEWGKSRTMRRSRKCSKLFSGIWLRWGDKSCSDLVNLSWSIYNREWWISLPSKVHSTVECTLLVPNMATSQLCGASVAKGDLCFLTTSCTSWLSWD